MTATPPLSFARRSWSFSLSYSESEVAIASRIASQRASMSAASPPPLSTRVESLSMVISLAVPRSSRVASSSLAPNSSVNISPPVRIAMSWSDLVRFSPKPGALTAATWVTPRSLLTMRVVRASPSTSSAMITRGFCALATRSRMGTIDWIVESFFSKQSTYASLKVTTPVLGSVTKCGEMNPRSSFMPSTTSSSSLRVRPSLTVTTPSLPTFSIAVAMSLPSAASLFAEIVATCAICSEVETGIEMRLSSSTMALTAFLMPRWRSIGFMPAATDLQPSE
eukprot:Amastigsp_a4498_199.p3 type:complete len:280 gc:universal Amastigsp_a4498_199:1306-467(-)